MNSIPTTSPVKTVAAFGLPGFGRAICSQALAYANAELASDRFAQSQGSAYCERLARQHVWNFIQMGWGR